MLTGHSGCVRDVSWHGEQLDLVSDVWIVLRHMTYDEQLMTCDDI